MTTKEYIQSVAMPEDFEDELKKTQRKYKHIDPSEVEEIATHFAKTQKKLLLYKICKFIKDNVREYHKSGVFHVADFITDIRKAVAGDQPL